MFKRAGILFETLVTNIDEEKYKIAISDKFELVKELAKAKALFAKNKLSNKNENAIIIAADTIVELDGEIIGKAHELLKSRGLLLLEFGEDQSSSVKYLIDNTDSYSEVEIIKDLAGSNRIAKALKR